MSCSDLNNDPLFYLNARDYELKINNDTIDTMPLAVGNSFILDLKTYASYKFK